jgi:hypothetical protein
VSDNKRNIEHEVAPAGPGPQQCSGTGAHEQNRVEAERAEQDRQALGREGQKASGDKPAAGRKGR